VQPEFVGHDDWQLLDKHIKLAFTLVELTQLAFVIEKPLMLRFTSIGVSCDKGWDCWAETREAKNK
ncbi:MAG: hypothetical protein QXF12_02480, partial [Candidatus Aenigmatarchaeota archaeon]